MRWLYALCVVSIALGCARGGMDDPVDSGPPPPPMDSGDADAGVDAGPPGDCFDGMRNGDETDRDCGGTCPGCRNGDACLVASDCLEMACVADVCGEPACDDGFTNGDESDVDCGGLDCDPCSNDSICFGDEDCASSSCTGGICTGPTCDDGVLNGAETDTDCGGDTCPGCGTGLGCDMDPDCASGVCTSAMCAAPACDDTIQNGDETDTDCGGGTCPGCPGRAMCLIDGDCISATCTTGMCDGNPRSCQEILATSPGATSGAYPIQPDPAGTTQMVYCDMTTDGGGWTLVASTSGTTMDDAAMPYHADLATIDPAAAHPGIWDGMRAVIAASSDIRFTCRSTTAPGAMTVDLSFYDTGWYREITTGTDAMSCFNESNGTGYDRPAAARRDNVSGMMIASGVDWTFGYMEGEDSCTDTGDFTVDFNDRGMDSNQSDGTDWGEDDSSRKCGTSGITTGVWHIWVREP